MERVFRNHERARIVAATIMNLAVEDRWGMMKEGSTAEPHARFADSQDWDDEGDDDWFGDNNDDESHHHDHPHAQHRTHSRAVPLAAEGEWDPAMYTRTGTGPVYPSPPGPFQGGARSENGGRGGKYGG